jgi:hypothetical protein
MRPDREGDMAPLDAVRKMITGMLADMTPDARLTELADSPDARWYTVRVEIPGTISKDFVVPKALVLSARSDPAARRAIWNVLRVEIRMQRSRVAIEMSREMLAGIERAEVMICPRCSVPIAPDESVRFEHGEVFHLECNEKGQP